MEEVIKMVDVITRRTFDILKSIYVYRIEGQPTMLEDLGSRIIFPHYSTIHRNGEIRLSEQELRFVFVEQFNKYCTEKDLHYYYSVETPTEHKYSFSDKTNPCKNDDCGQSAMVDFAIHDEHLKRTALIEFKALNPDIFCFEKDFCILKEEQSSEDEICTFFIMFVKSSNKETISSIQKKIQKKPSNTIFRCYDLEAGKEISLD